MSHRLYFALGREKWADTLDQFDLNEDSKRGPLDSGALKTYPAYQFAPAPPTKGRWIMEVDPNEANFSRFQGNVQAWLKKFSDDKNIPKDDPEFQNLVRYLENPKILNVTFDVSQEGLEILQKTGVPFVAEKGIRRVTVSFPSVDLLTPDQKTRLKNFYILAAGSAQWAGGVPGRFGAGFATLFDFAGESLVPTTQAGYYDAAFSLQEGGLRARMNAAIKKCEEVSRKENFDAYPYLSGADMHRWENEARQSQLDALMAPYQDQIKKSPGEKSKILARAREEARKKLEALTPIRRQWSEILVEIVGVRMAYQKLNSALKTLAPRDHTTFDLPNTPANESEKREWEFVNSIDGLIEGLTRKQTSIENTKYRLDLLISILNFQAIAEEIKPKKGGKGKPVEKPAAPPPPAPPPSTNPNCDPDFEECG